MQGARATLGPGISFLLLAAPLATQPPPDLQELAEALLESHIPGRDAPGPLARQLLATAGRNSSTAAASLLLRRAAPVLPSVEKPATLLPVLAAMAGKGKGKGNTANGEVAHQARTMRRRLLILLGRRQELEPKADFAGFASQFTVIGPFGDEGDYYSGVAFPPEKKFPEPGTLLPGRFGFVSSRKVQRLPYRFDVELREPRRGHEGCFYALHQVESAAETQAYLRIYCAGSFSLFVNGRKLARVDRLAQESPKLHYLPVVLRKGHNQVLVRTGDNEVSSFSLRYTDRSCRPLSGLLEFANCPQLRVPSRLEPKTAPPPNWLSGLDILEEAAAKTKGEARARLYLAAALASADQGLHERSLGLVDRVQRAAPQAPRAPRLRLALAMALRRSPILPAAIAESLARQLVDGLGTELGDHHSLFMFQIRHLEDEDRRERAIQRLRLRIETGLAGPTAFNRLASIYESLEFEAEGRRLRTLWMQRAPTDLRPLLAEIRERRRWGDLRGALRLARRRLQRQPGDARLLGPVFEMAAALGQAELAQAELAQAALEALHPQLPRTLARLRTEASLARALGHEDAFLQLREQIAAHPRASLGQIRTAADHLLEAGRGAAAERLDRQVLRESPEQHELHRRRQRLAGLEEYPDMARFRVPVEPLVREFAPTAREAGSSSSLVLDHMIIEVFADGSSVEEVHTLRRINDQSGVEEYQNASDAAGADELLVLRTIDPKGRSYVPNRVAEEFSMPRLRPGAFIEKTYRNFRYSPEPGPWRSAKFYFQNQDCPFLRSELVIILPEGHRGNFRLRNFPTKAVVQRLPSGKTAHTYRIDNSVRLAPEFSPPPIADIIPVLAFGEDRSPMPLARRYRSTMERRILVTAMIQRQADGLVQGRTSDLARAQAIHDFVHREIVLAQSSPEPTSVLMLKKGPRFFLELALLKAAGIPFRHGLCAFQHQGLRQEAKPFFKGEIPYEVSCALVQVQGKGQGKGHADYWLFVDSPRYYPLGWFPASRRGAEVMLVDPPTFSQLPASKDKKGRGIKAVGNLTLDVEGQASLELEITMLGEQGYRAAEGLRNEVQDRRALIARGVMGRMMQGWTLAEVELLHLQDKGPLKMHGRLRRRRALEPAGGDFLLRLPIMPASLLPRLGGRSKRTLPLQLFTEIWMQWRITVDPGHAYEIIEIPASLVEDRPPLLAYELRLERDGPRVTITREFLQSTGKIPAERFADWRAFLKKVDKAEAAHLKLRRKQ